MYKKLNKENVKEFAAVAGIKAKELGKACLEVYVEFIKMCQLITGTISRCIRKLWTLSWQAAIIAIALMLFFKEHYPIEYASFVNAAIESISTGKTVFMEAWTTVINNLHNNLHIF